MDKKLTDIMDKYREKFISLHELLLEKVKLEYIADSEEAKRLSESITKQIESIRNISYEDMMYIEMRNRIYAVESDIEDIEADIDELKEKSEN